MTIEVRNINKSYGEFKALAGVALKVNSGELVALLGPSGSGKTTLLRVIAGMERPDVGSGPVLFDGRDVSSLELGKRGIGFVFQHYALFKHMTVFENVAFGLRSKPRASRPKEAEIHSKVMELLRLIHLEGQASRYPSQLSGGQRQRVALARALAVEPRVLLLDEPFGALDATVRRELRRWLRKLHDTIHVTTIFVTHDQEEALEVSDRIAVMNGGKIEQYDTPENVYDKPASPFVFKFLGNYNLFHARQELGDETAHQESGPSRALFVRPHDIEIHRTQVNNAIPAKVAHIGFGGSIVNVELQRLDTKETVDAELPLSAFRQLNLQSADHVFLSVRDQKEFVADYSI